MNLILERLFDYDTLSYNEAKNLMKFITENRYNPSQVSSFLTIYNLRGVTVDELKGFRDALLSKCLRIDLDDYHPIDLCGTGGDGKDTFNISTVSAFVTAGAGIKVAKHGNYGISSKCGSSNVLEQLGVVFSSDQDFLERCIEQAGICILHAPLFHPAMKNVAPVRKALGVKTIFNILGPLVNPVSPEKQLAGVYSLEIARLYNYLFQEVIGHYTVVYDTDHYDEISLTSTAKLFTENGEHLVDASTFKVSEVKPVEIAGGDTIEESGEILIDILKGKGTKSQENVVCANAGVAIATALSTSFQEGYERAKESIKSKRAYKSIEALLKISATWTH